MRRFVRVILDALTPGTPRHARSVDVMDAETARLRRLLADRVGGAALHPLDEITLTTQEVLAGFEEMSL